MGNTKHSRNKQIHKTIQPKEKARIMAGNLELQAYTARTNG